LQLLILLFRARQPLAAIEPGAIDSEEDW